jgi:hypothetical protein
MSQSAGIPVGATDYPGKGTGLLMGGHVPFFRGGYGDDRRLKKKKRKEKKISRLLELAL